MIPAQSRLAAEFVLLRKLGHGAMGSVFHARHRLDGGQYAVKIVPFFVRANDTPAGLTREAERVLREVQALSRLNHPNVCRYHNAWVETDWASLWKGQAPSAATGAGAAPVPGGPAALSRLPLLLTGGGADPSAEPSGYSDEPGSFCDDGSSVGWIRGGAGGGGGARTCGGSPSGFSFSAGSADGVSFLSSSSAPQGASLDSGPSIESPSCGVLGAPAPSLGRQWSYRKALLIQVRSLCRGPTRICRFHKNNTTPATSTTGHDEPASLGPPQHLHTARP